MNHRLSILSILLLIGSCVVLSIPKSKQQISPERTQSATRVHLLHADRLYYDDRIHRTAQFLVGDVQFTHDGIYMYCDSALFYEASNSFDAYGNVRMVQGDTLSLTGDVLFYNGVDQLARVRHNVVLRHCETTL